jgi:molecular chaperone GrpE
MSDEDTKDTTNTQMDNEENTSFTDSELEVLKAEIETLKTKNLQLMADFQNFQRRMDGEKAMFGALANMSLIQDVLEVFDDLNMAVNDENLDLDNSKTSIKSAQDKLVSSIERAGVERINVNVGDEFNKDIMEAISTIPVQEEDKKGKVVAVISSAFKYRDRDGIIKAAKVVVGK